MQNQYLQREQIKIYTGDDTIQKIELYQQNYCNNCKRSCALGFIYIHYIHLYTLYTYVQCVRNKIKSTRINCDRGWVAWVV